MMDARSAAVAGIEMHWEECGAGHPVVFLHGIPTSPRLWRHVLPRVAGARAFAWELVGYGASIPAGRGRDLSVAKQADYLASWLRTLAVEPAILVGHDLGGGVAQITAARYPELVGGLVLMNSIAYDSWPIPSVKTLRALGPLVARLPNAAVFGILATLMVRGHDDRGQMRESLREHWHPYAAVDGAAALARQVRALDVRDTLAVADQLPHLGVPARLVWGAADPFQPIGYGYRLAHDLGARLDRIAGGKHFVPEDHPDRVAATVTTLLQQVAG